MSSWMLDSHKLSFVLLGGKMMRKKNVARLAGLWAILLFFTLGISYGQTIDESGDAGDLPSSAQDASGISITRISGTIPYSSKWYPNDHDVDMYKITINDPDAFSATTHENETDFDTCLFLFDSNGKAVYMNVDTPRPGYVLPYRQSTLPAGDTYGPTEAGDYYLAVTGYNVLPYDEDYNRVFDTGSSQAVLGPSLSDKPVYEWTTPDRYPYFFHSGSYQIDLTGVGPLGPVLDDVSDMSQVTISRFRFNRRTGQISVMVTWTNISAEPILAPLYMVIEDINPGSVTVANEDETTLDGKPYFDFSDQVGVDEVLSPGETSAARQIIFENAGRVRFSFDVSCWGVLDVGPE